jgi:hypothetical protein
LVSERKAKSESKMVCSVPCTTISQSVGSDTSGYEGTNDASLYDWKVVEVLSIA